MKHRPNSDGSSEGLKWNSSIAEKKKIYTIILVKIISSTRLISCAIFQHILRRSKARV